MPHLSSVLATMLRIQWLTGMRPGELRVMRPMDIDQSSDVWIFEPAEHKNAYRGLSRRIPLGPRAQDALIPLLAGRPRSAYVFSPEDSINEHREKRREARTTPIAQGNSVGTNRIANPKKKPGEMCSPTAYGQAIARACRKAGIEHWAPNMVRHATATQVRKDYGLEGAQLICGHAKCDTTQIYAERDEAKAMEIAREIG